MNLGCTTLLWDLKRMRQNILKNGSPQRCFHLSVKQADIRWHHKPTLMPFANWPIRQKRRNALRCCWKRKTASLNRFGNHVMQHNKYVHSKGEGFRHATIAHVKSVIPGKYSWQTLANYCSYHGLSVEILTPHYQSVPLNSYPAEAWMAIYNIDISGL